MILLFIFRVYYDDFFFPKLKGRRVKQKLKEYKVKMNDNLSTQTSNSKRKAITSLALGIISVIPIITREWILPSLVLAPMLPPILELIFFIIFFILPLFGLPGVILGMIGLKSTKRNFAIAGIILCIIGLVTPILYFVFS